MQGGGSLGPKSENRRVTRRPPVVVQASPGVAFFLGEVFPLRLAPRASARAVAVEQLKVPLLDRQDKGPFFGRSSHWWFSRSGRAGTLFELTEVMGFPALSAGVLDVFAARGRALRGIEVKLAEVRL